MVQVSRLGGGLLQATEATDCTKGLLIITITNTIVLKDFSNVSYLIIQVSYEGDTRNFDDYPETDWRQVDRCLLQNC